MLHIIARHLLPAPVHRVGLRLAHGARVRWWRWRRPIVEGCRVIALDADGRVLLVRHSYGTSAWMPPGGGIARGEDPIAAGIRELGEELGCRLDNAQLVDIVLDTYHGAGNRVHVVLGLARGEPRPDGREVVAAEFFAVSQLPENLERGLREGIARWLAHESAPPAE